MIKKYIGTGLVALGLLVSMGVGAIPAQAASLTEAQISEVISLLSSFGADSSTIASINAALHDQTTAGTTTPSCLTLSYNLHFGLSDSSTGGQVSQLQQFLVSAGAYPEARISGYYGTLTAQAVVRWQKAHGMDFVTLTSGVGPMTRAKMKCENPNSTAQKLHWSY